MKILKLPLFIIILSGMFFSSCKVQEQNKDFVQTINDNWTLQNSSQVNVEGAELSTTSYSDANWYKVDIPSTVLNALIENDVYTDVYFGKNLEAIDKSQFETSWWYRKVFSVEEVAENNELVFEGVNYKANIWLNGKLIADAKTIEGAFKISTLDVTEFISTGENVLAIEVIPPKRGDLTIGFVDWNPTPPDQNMGLWRGVHLKQSGKASLINVFVASDVNIETLDEASIEISTTLRNHASEDISVKLVGTTADITFEEIYSVPANSEINVAIGKEQVAGLNIKNPKLWWPVNLGEPNLYDLKLELYVNDELSDCQNIRYGIREIEQFKTEDGHKGFKVNGKKVLVRGGGWVDDMLLADSDEKVRAQVEYTKHMNLNTIRLEGFWGANKTIYDAADENGILLMIGWSCHWEWAEYCGRTEYQHHMSIDTPELMELHSDAFVDQILWLRNHPSVFLWVYGSDKLPFTELEQMLETKIAPVDPTRPRLSSCRAHPVGEPEEQVSEVSGRVGVKMRGPYSYVTPNYWYVDNEYGGAYGFNTETGPGPQVPPIESMKKMLPEQGLWPMGDMWNYHNGRHAFGTLDIYLEAFNARYGEAASVEEFTFMSQISNYEAIRAMFEAFAVNKYQATGVIQWMLNSAWPETYWQLYDWYLRPNGAFYGTKKSCEPLHLVYNYGDKNIYLVNEYLKGFENLKTEVKVFDINGKEVFNKSFDTNIDENTAIKVLDFTQPENVTKAYFLHLNLTNAEGEQISDNFYWLSTQDDVLDFDKTNWHWTPNSSFADLTELKTMPKTEIDVVSNIYEEGDDFICEVDLKNPSDKLAFFIELRLTDSLTGEFILPVFWDDNYLSLLPGESKVVKAKFSKKVAEGKQPEFSVKGLNIK